MNNCRFTVARNHIRTYHKYKETVQAFFEFSSFVCNPVSSLVPPLHFESLPLSFGLFNFSVVIQIDYYYQL